MSTAYQLTDHALPSKAIVDAMDDPHAVEAWQVWLHEEGEKSQLIRSFKASEKDRARVCFQAVQDGNHEPEYSVELRPVVDSFFRIEQSQALARRQAKHRKRRDRAYWSRRFHAYLLAIEGASEDCPVSLTVNEDLGDEYGLMPEETSVSCSVELTIPNGDNMAAHILGQMYGALWLLEQRFREAGLIPEQSRPLEAARNISPKNNSAVACCCGSSE